MQQYYPQSTGIKQVKLSDRLNDKPFWIWDVEEHKLEDIRAKEIVVLIISFICQRRMN